MPQYTVVETPREWFPALLDCRARGLELAAILSKEQERAVEAVVHKYNNTGKSNKESTFFVNYCKFSKMTKYKREMLTEQK